MLEPAVRKTLPASVRRIIRRIAGRGYSWKRNMSVSLLRMKARGLEPGSQIRCSDYIVRVNDGLSFYIQYKDIFVNRIYHFQAKDSEPIILDCGSNIGISILYFKHVYPTARIIAFEPDPVIFPYLQENVTRNGLQDVKLIQAALAPHEGKFTLWSDGKYGSFVTAQTSGDIPRGWTRHDVKTVRLREYLDQPVDFLKMNIEGAEYEVLADSAERLRMIREMVLEYHHLPRVPQSLHGILTILHEQGFDFLINDFDSETNGSVLTPIHADTRNVLLPSHIRTPLGLGCRRSH